MHAHTSPRRPSAVLHGKGQTFSLLHSATLMKLTHRNKGEGRTPVKVQGMRWYETTRQIIDVLFRELTSNWSSLQGVWYLMWYLKYWLLFLEAVRQGQEESCCCFCRAQPPPRAHQWGEHSQQPEARPSSPCVDGHMPSDIHQLQESSTPTHRPLLMAQSRLKLFLDQFSPKGESSRTVIN